MPELNTEVTPAKIGFNMTEAPQLTATGES